MPCEVWPFSEGSHGCRKVQIGNRIIYILQGFGLMELCSGSPWGGKKCGNEELICVDKMPWWLYDLCCCTLRCKKKKKKKKME